MPRNKKPNRKPAGNTTVARSTRRRVTPKQVKGQGDLTRPGRTGQVPARMTRFPGRQGGR